MDYLEQAQGFVESAEPPTQIPVEYPPPPPQVKHSCLPCVFNFVSSHVHLISAFTCTIHPLLILFHFRLFALLILCLYSDFFPYLWYGTYCTIFDLQPLLCWLSELKATLLSEFCFRNLSLGGGPEVCVKMVDQDVMTPLITFIHQVMTAVCIKLHATCIASFSYSLEEI